MIKLLVSSLILVILFGCSPATSNSFNCGDELSDSELKTYRQSTFKNYSDTDLDKLAEITSAVVKCNGDTTEFEVFFNKKENDLLAIDIFGISDLNQIHKTACALKTEKALQLPSTTILLFHSYSKDLQDAGIVAAVKLK